MFDRYSMGARNQHKAGGAYEFHIHRAYIIYDVMYKIACYNVSLLYFVWADQRVQPF